MSLCPQVSLRGSGLELGGVLVPGEASRLPSRKVRTLSFDGHAGLGSAALAGPFPCSWSPLGRGCCLWAQLGRDRGTLLSCRTREGKANPVSTSSDGSWVLRVSEHLLSPPGIRPRLGTLNPPWQKGVPGLCRVRGPAEEMQPRHPHPAPLCVHPETPHPLAPAPRSPCSSHAHCSRPP